MASRELIQVFIPEGDRTDKSIPVDLHDQWVIRFLALSSELFGGATSYGRGVGVWEGSRARCWDRVTVIEAWYEPSLPRLAQRLLRLQRALSRMGRALRQEAIVAMIAGEMLICHTGAAR